MRFTLTWLLLALPLLAGCPPRDRPGTGPTANPSIPSEPLPVKGKLLAYDKLHLGMSALELAQVYNAPEGHGDGFQRLVQDFDGVQHHVVRFDDQAGQPRRKLVLALLRDELYEIVDRRDLVTREQADAWFATLENQYGPPAAMTVQGAQWVWGPESGVQLTFTQDNANETAMSANVVLLFKPYADAAYSYLADWQKAHPGYEPVELPF